MLKPSGGLFKKMFNPGNMAKRLRKGVGAVGGAVGIGGGGGKKRMPGGPIGALTRKMGMGGPKRMPGRIGGTSAASQEPGQPGGGRFRRPNLDMEMGRGFPGGPPIDTFPPQGGAPRGNGSPRVGIPGREFKRVERVE